MAKTLLERAQLLRERRHAAKTDNGADTPMDFGGPRAAQTASELGLPLDDVVVIFAIDEQYVPYFSVLLQSIKESASPNRRYDLIVLSRGLTLHSISSLSRQATSDNMGIGFLDADAALGDIKLPKHGHFRTETYYRLLAPELLNNVKKAVYLDSDLVVLRDIAELFDTDVDGYLLAATQDADTIGQALGYEPTVATYLTDVVGLPSPLDYLQAGVLVMNLEEFRRQCTSAELIDLAASRHWQWLDQDVLNHVVRGHYKRVPMCWNTLMDWQGLRRTHIIGAAPVDVRKAYEEARKTPAIVHYAGPDDRPWVNPDADMGEFFWAFASECPYYDELVRRLHTYRNSLRTAPKRSQIFMLYKVGMPLYDLVAPTGSKRRELGVKLYRKVGLELI